MAYKPCIYIFSPNWQYAPHSLPSQQKSCEVYENSTSNFVHLTPLEWKLKKSYQVLLKWQCSLANTYVSDIWSTVIFYWKNHGLNNLCQCDTLGLTWHHFAYNAMHWGAFTWYATSSMTSCATCCSTTCCTTPAFTGVGSCHMWLLNMIHWSAVSRVNDLQRKLLAAACVAGNLVSILNCCEVTPERTAVTQLLQARVTA